MNAVVFVFMQEERLMKKRFCINVMLGAVTAILIMGCGVSEEKLSQAESAKSDLIEAKQKAEQTYLDMVDSSNRDTLDELAGREAEYEDMDISKLNDKKIDELLPQLQELTEQYNQTQSKMDKTLEKETEERKERQKHSSVDVFFVNKTGMNLKSIILRDITQNINSDNYIGDGVTLNAGYTLMGAQLDLYEDSSEWEFVIKDENGTEYNLPSDNLKDIGQDGASIVLKYDSKEGTGSASTGSYVAIKEPEETAESPEGAYAEGEQEAAQDASKEENKDASDSASKEGSGEGGN